MIQILVRMIEANVEKRWSAEKYLKQGFRNGLFKRRFVDDIVTSASDPNDEGDDEGDDEARTPTRASSPS